MKTELAFWDTSALVPLCCAQAGLSSRSRQLFRQFKRPIIWWGTEVEIHSALARLKDEGALTEREMASSIKRWEMLRQVARDVNPTAQVLRLAVELPARYQLRALDAFQLAAAIAWCQEQPRRRPFICFDDRLARAATAAGFTVSTL